MLLMVAYEGALVEMPPFISRLQAVRVDAEPARIHRLVDEVKTLFQRGAGGTEEAVKALAALVQKHVLAVHDHDLTAWLHQRCGLDIADAAPLARRAAAAADSARELVVGLLALLPGEGQRSAALARLVMVLHAGARLRHPRPARSTLLRAKAAALPPRREWLARAPRARPAVGGGAGTRR
jgi:hypothetical protein